MEEQKNKTKMDAPKEQEKLTYEQLNNACVQLSQQNQELRQELEHAYNVLNTYNRLDYLFRVVECDHNNKINSISFSRDFVEKCVKKIEIIMAFSAEEEKDKKEN